MLVLICKVSLTHERRKIKIVRITLLADRELEPIYHSMVVFTILVK